MPRGIMRTSHFWNALCQPSHDFQNQLSPTGQTMFTSCLLYTSDAADERSSVDLGGRRIIKKKIKTESVGDKL